MTSCTSRVRFIAALFVVFTLAIWRYHQNSAPPVDLSEVREGSLTIQMAESLSRVPQESTPTSSPQKESQIGQRPPEEKPLLPSIYTEKNVKSSSLCADRFGIPFLEHLNASATSYCTSESQARSTCFNVTTEKTRVDDFCISGPVEYSPERRKFILPCTLEHGKSFGSLSSYWYQTGPWFVYDEYVDVEYHSLRQIPSKQNPGILLLVKREGSNNLWHSLMEIFVAAMSIDVLQMAREPRDRSRLVPTDDEIEQLRVVVLDDHDEGPFWRLWNGLSSRPLIRISQLTAETASNSHIVVPLAGGGNPFWQGDWEVLPCRESDLLQVFVQRIFEWCEVNSTRQTYDAQTIRLTYVDRRTQRKLSEKDAHIQALRDRFPEIKVEVVDFARISFPEQIQKARDTDVLVGVHGAGLTHAMFMDRESAVVEIMPEKLDHKGFRNLAKFRGLHYFSSHGTEASPGIDWHSADVSLDIEKYLHLVDAAVASVSNSGLRNKDIV